jgi:hypothetical protein
VSRCATKSILCIRLLVFFIVFFRLLPSSLVIIHIFCFLRFSTVGLFFIKGNGNVCLNVRTHAQVRSCIGQYRNNDNQKNDIGWLFDYAKVVFLDRPYCELEKKILMFGSR